MKKLYSLSFISCHENMNIEYRLQNKMSYKNLLFVIVIEQQVYSDKTVN